MFDEKGWTLPGLKEAERSRWFASRAGLEQPLGCLLSTRPPLPAGLLPFSLTITTGEERAAYTVG